VFIQVRQKNTQLIHVEFPVLAQIVFGKHFLGIRTNGHTDPVTTRVHAHHMKNRGPERENSDFAVSRLLPLQSAAGALKRSR
jgi:hypothetical protein